MGERVIVGMSGGVDSSVAAYLLKQQGYEVIGVTMQVWDAACSLQMEREGGCCGQSAVDDARRVCGVIGIPYYVIGFRDIFQKEVIDYFVSEYRKGRTPNPCLMCNRYVKWEAMLRVADQIGARYVATGHYARILEIPTSDDFDSNYKMADTGSGDKRDGTLSLCHENQRGAKKAAARYTVRNSVTAAKDQTYALYRLTQEQLSRTLMPIGDYYKEDVRRIAAEAGLPVAQKPDSEEVCFVSDDDYGGYIDRYLAEHGEKPVSAGRFVYKDGRDLGPNRGITHYTVGQRRHLGIAMGHRVVVTGIDPLTNTVRIGEDEDCWSDTLVCCHLNFMAAASEDMPVGTVWGKTVSAFGTEIRNGTVPASGISGENPGKRDVANRNITGKIRYGAKAVPCTIVRTGEDEITVHFHEKVRAVTPGQSAVFYEDDYILCGGIIK